MEVLLNMPNVLSLLIKMKWFFIIAIFFFLIAVIMYLVDLEPVFGLSINIASTCLATLLLLSIYRISGGEPIEKLEKEIQEQKVRVERICSLVELGVPNGLLQVSSNREGSENDPKKMWSDFLDRQENGLGPVDIDILGNVSHDIIQSLNNSKNREKLIKNIKNGSKVKIILLHPEGTAAKIRKGDEHSGGNVGKGSESNFQERIKGILKEVKEEQFTFGFYNVTSSCHIIRVGDKMLVTHYLYGMTGRYCPEYLIQKTNDCKLFEKYYEHYENVLESGTVVTYKIDSNGNLNLYKYKSAISG